MNDVVRVQDLFDVPEQVRKTDFVLKLAEGVTQAEETARSYVVTPGIHDAIDGALGIVKSSIDRARSHAAYVNGSFGSGKSHYMAVLSLLLDNSEAAWRIPKLHDLRDKHGWVRTKKVLQLRFHMVGQKTLESAIFAEYVRWVRENRPEATVPPLFADEQLFDDARTLLGTLGDEKFFAPMNPQSTDARWGKRSAAAQWTRERFERAAASTDPHEREKLFDALVRSHFKAFASQRDRFVDIDTGLATLSRHAQGLGFDAVVLFLDELVLWLASRASEASWLHTEVQKTAKLVEAQDAARTIPIASFIARQRDLADLVGDDLAGAENKRLRESLDWFQGRFERITLEDNNLPAIVSERILRPKSDQARKELDDAFAQLQRKAGASWSTLLGEEGDAAAFRKLYPFSPALVETLVALSNSLQRNRTAIRLLMEILVDYIPDLELGQLVPVGDLFDVLAGGDDTADGVMKARFEQAKQLYSYRLLPMLHETHGTGTPARCQRLRPEHRASLGCAGCPEGACRTDNRLVKTLLLSALVPEVKALKRLTASRLVQLNHGTLRAPIPGTEASLAAQRLRQWASTLGQIHVDGQADPTVYIDVGGVDLEPILQQARNADNPGARQAIVRNMLFESLGLDPTPEREQDDSIEWRGTVRRGHVVFGNVRRLQPEALRCPDHHDWRLVLDYPFDEIGFGPNDDLEVVERVRDEGGGTWTLAWLPSFFSEAVNKMLGELAILDDVLRTRESRRQAVQHLRVEQQANAELGLENLRSQKRNRVHGALLQAYGLARETEQDIDPSRSLQSHFYVLKPGVRIQPPIGGTLSVAREVCVPALLGLRYPRHPELRKLTKQVSARVLELFSDLLEAEGRRLVLDKEDLEKAQSTLGQLGLVRRSENAILLVEDVTLQDLERKRQQKSVDHPTAAEVRDWLDPRGSDGERKMGLQPEAADLVVRAYARWASRTLVRYGKPYEATFGTPIPDDVALEKPELPTPQEWSAALDMAGHAFGITLPRKALHADNVKRFEVEVSGKVKAVAPKAAALPALLERRLSELDVGGDVDRLQTARSSSTLCATLLGKGGVEQVRALATFHASTSPKAIGANVASATATVQTLEDPLIFGAFDWLQGPEGAELRQQVQRVLRQDEIHEALAPRLRALAESANAARRLADGPGAMPEAPPAARDATHTSAASFSYRVRKTEALDALATATQKLRDALTQEKDDVEVTIDVRIHRRRT